MKFYMKNNYDFVNLLHGPLLMSYERNQSFGYFFFRNNSIEKHVHLKLFIMEKIIKSMLK